MALRGIDTNLLVALHALLHARNVTHAARSLGLGQSATSHALARLRAHFADPLLVRAGRAMVLSERAVALIEPVDLAVAQLERVFAARAAFDPATSTRTFRIVGTDNLELYLLPRLAAILAREAPQIDLRFHHLRPDWATALKAGDADLKLGRKYDPGPGLRSEDLLDERLVCVVRRGHPVAAGRLTRARYAALRHVAVAPTMAPGETFATFVDDALARLGVRRRVAVTVPHFLVAPFVVASTDLALTTSERLVETVRRALALRVVELPLRLPAYTLSQVWADRAHSDPAHQWLRRAVARALAP